MPGVALFDMDKTLIRVNSARLFTQFRRDRGEVGALMSLRVSWWLFRYWLGHLDATMIARKLLEEYKNTTEDDMKTMCQEWFSSYVVQHISTHARQAVERHRKNGERLVIATSATQFAAQPLLRELNMDDVVCTRLSIEKGRLTGDIDLPICYGRGKLELVRAFVEQTNGSLKQATFYSDSITDLPLLASVGNPVVINPDARLYVEAKRRAWPIESW